MKIGSVIGRVRRLDLVVLCLNRFQSCVKNRVRESGKVARSPIGRLLGE
jgi:hypothetical protein